MRKQRAAGWKKTGLLLILCSSFLLLAGCGPANGPGQDNNGQQGADKKLHIVTTAFPPYDLARQLAGERASVTMLLKPGTEAHIYEPTPRDMMAVQNCDLFLYIGGESEDWVGQVLSGTDRKVESLALIDCVEGLEEEIVEGMYEREPLTGGDPESAEQETDEHVWTSPVNVMAISRKICAALQKADPEGKEQYAKRLEAYEKQLAKLDQEFRDIVENASRRTLFFGDRFPFRYFAEEYGLSYYAAFPGCSSESEPSVSTMIFLTDIIKEQKIPVVFTLEMSNGKIADTLCRETGAKKMLFHSCHNVTRQEYEAGETYLSLMEKNARRLCEALE